MENKRISVVFLGKGITNVNIQPKTQQTLNRISGRLNSPTVSKVAFNSNQGAIISTNISNLGKSLLSPTVSINTYHSKYQQTHNQPLKPTADVGEQNW